MFCFVFLSSCLFASLSFIFLQNDFTLKVNIWRICRELVHCEHQTQIRESENPINTALSCINLIYTSCVNPLQFQFCACYVRRCECECECEVITNSSLFFFASAYLSPTHNTVRHFPNSRLRILKTCATRNSQSLRKRNKRETRTNNNGT